MFGTVTILVAGVVRTSSTERRLSARESQLKIKKLLVINCPCNLNGKWVSPGILGDLETIRIFVSV